MEIELIFGIGAMEKNMKILNKERFNKQKQGFREDEKRSFPFKNRGDIKNEIIFECHLLMERNNNK